MFFGGVKGEDSMELESRGESFGIADKKKAKSEDLAF